jgi:hypothetical protein
MAFKSLHDFNLETFATEVLLTLASVTTGQSFGYFICVNFARVIFHLSYFYAIAADRRTRVQHLFSKPRSSVLMSSHLSENSGVGICEIGKTVGRKASNRKCKAAFVRMRSSKKRAVPRVKSLKTLERVKGIEPSYSAWKGFGG